MTKMRAMSGARARTSRRLRSGRYLFLGLVRGPKNIFCTTPSMYTAARMTPAAAPTVWMPLNTLSGLEAKVPMMIMNSPTKPLVPGTPMEARVTITKRAA